MNPDEFLLIVLCFLFCFLVLTYIVESLLILMPSFLFFSFALLLIPSYLCFYFNALLLNKHLAHLHLFHTSEQRSTVFLILCVVPILSIYPRTPLLAHRYPFSCSPPPRWHSWMKESCLLGLACYSRSWCSVSQGHVKQERWGCA